MTTKCCDLECEHGHGPIEIPARTFLTPLPASTRREHVRAVQAVFGEGGGICDICQAIVADATAHRDWHRRSDGPHYEQGFGR